MKRLDWYTLWAVEKGKRSLSSGERQQVIKRIERHGEFSGLYGSRVLSFCKDQELARDCAMSEYHYAMDQIGL